MNEKLPNINKGATEPLNIQSLLETSKSFLPVITVVNCNDSLCFGLVFQKDLLHEFFVQMNISPNITKYFCL